MLLFLGSSSPFPPSVDDPVDEFGRLRGHVDVVHKLFAKNECLVSSSSPSLLPLSLLLPTTPAPPRFVHRALDGA